MLKVGTKVIVTMNGNEIEGEIVKVDTVGKIPYRVDFQGGSHWFYSNFTSPYVNGESFRVAEEKHTFKDGDKVRLKEKFYDEDDFKSDDKHQRKEIAKLKGRAWTINSVDFNSVWKQVRVSGDSTCRYTVPVSLLELVEKPVVEVKRKAKVGEYVKVIKEDSMWEAKIGIIGKVVFSGFFGCVIIVENKDYYVRFQNIVVLENYVPKEKPLRKWTDAEIMEAKAIIGEFLTRNSCYFSYKSYINKNRGDAICVYVGNEKGVAKCCATDDWNYYIGTMVALCKATGRELPKWIKKGETK
jgi:hypothetical protein